MNKIHSHYGVVNTRIEASTTLGSLDSLMLQRLQSHPNRYSPAFQLNNQTPVETPKPSAALVAFLQRYKQAVAEGKFIFTYNKNDAEIKNQQFSADLSLFYKLMEPDPGSDNVSPSMREMQEWLVTLISLSAPEKDEPSETPANDEEAFLRDMFNYFVLVYKKTYDNFIDKTKEEMLKPLTASWEQANINSEPIEQQW